MAEKSKEQIAMRVSRVSIAANIALSVMKLAAGIFAHSGAMVSDAVHSASDVLSTVIVMVGVHMSEKASDSEHQYGHERMECVAALLLSIALAVTGIGIGLNGIEKITSAQNLVVPGTLALAAAIISIISKELMFRYTKRAAKRINSGALLADAWHHRSDALSSVGSFAGIAGARLGFPILDPIASVIICLFILYAAFEIFRDAISKMTDHSCDEETSHKILLVCASQPEVVAVDLLRTRLFGDKIYVDVEIAVDGNLSLFQAHDVAERTHDAIEKEFPLVKHCMVHVNPASPVSGKDE